MKITEGKLVHGKAGGYCVVELLNTDGDVVGYAVLDPSGKVLGAFFSKEDAVAALEELLKPAPPRQSDGPYFGP